MSRQDPGVPPTTLTSGAQTVTITAADADADANTASGGEDTLTLQVSGRARPTLAGLRRRIGWRRTARVALA